MLEISNCSFRHSKAKLSKELFNSGLIPIHACVLSYLAQGHNGGTGLAFSCFEHKQHVLNTNNIHVVR